MTHDEAVTDGATERYILEEMSDEEREEFEKHYFDCAVCAEDVKAGYAIRDGLAQAQFTPPVVVPFEPRRRRIATPLATIAASLGFGLFGWAQLIQKPAMMAQVTAATVAFAPATATIEPLRGEERPVYHAGTNLTVRIDKRLNRPAPYTTQILDDRGQQQGPAFGTSEDHQLITVPPGFKPGDYTIRVSDANRKVIYDTGITIR